MSGGNTDQNIKSIGSPVTVFIVFLVLALFLVFVLMPQNFWVDLSIKFFD